MKTQPLMLALTLPLLAGAAHAETLVRVRAIGILPATHSSPVAGVDVDNQLAPDLDLSWFINANVALELLLSLPQTHRVTLDGTDIGKAQHLPPTLLAQYHLPTGSRLRPYLGAGLNYTFFTDRNLDGGLKLEAGSFGPALQAGVDFALNGSWVLNADFKKIWIDSDVSAGGSPVTHLDIDPWVAGVGVGYRF